MSKVISKSILMSSIRSKIQFLAVSHGLLPDTELDTCNIANQSGKLVIAVVNRRALVAQPDRDCIHIEVNVISVSRIAVIGTEIAPSNQIINEQFFAMADINAAVDSYISRALALPFENCVVAPEQMFANVALREYDSQVSLAMRQLPEYKLRAAALESLTQAMSIVNNFGVTPDLQEVRDAARQATQAMQDLNVLFGHLAAKGK